MKNNIPLLVFTTICFVFLFPLYKSGFTLINYYDGLKDFTFPFALTFFAVIIFYYKFRIRQLKHFENISESNSNRDNDILQLETIKRKEITSQGQLELKKIETSYESIEMAALITGIIAGGLGVVVYFLQ